MVKDSLSSDMVQTTLAGISPTPEQENLAVRMLTTWQGQHKELAPSSEMVSLFCALAHLKADGGGRVTPSLIMKWKWKTNMKTAEFCEHSVWCVRKDNVTPSQRAHISKYLIDPSRIQQGLGLNTEASSHYYLDKGISQESLAQIGSYNRRRHRPAPKRDRPGDANPARN